LLARAGEGLPLAKKGPAAHKVLAAESVAGIFGLDMAEGAAEPTAAPAKQAKASAKKQKKTAKTRVTAAKKSSAAQA